MPAGSLHGRCYDLLIGPAEAAGIAAHRRELLAAATGSVLEVGGGTGRNLAYYDPERASGVVVLEPDASMRRRLLTRAVTSPVPVEVHDAGVEDHGLAPCSFDTVVCTLVLCSVPDLDGALASIRRLLKRDGKVLFLEHVRGTGWRARAQRAAAPAWSKVALGCRPDRDPVAAMRAGGLAVTRCRRVKLPLGPLLAPGVVGAAGPARRVIDLTSSYGPEHAEVAAGRPA